MYASQRATQYLSKFIRKNSYKFLAKFCSKFHFYLKICFKNVIDTLSIFLIWNVFEDDKYLKTRRNFKSKMFNTFKQQLLHESTTSFNGEGSYLYDRTIQTL